MAEQTHSSNRQLEAALNETRKDRDNLRVQLAIAQGKIAELQARTPAQPTYTFAGDHDVAVYWGEDGKLKATTYRQFTAGEPTVDRPWLPIKQAPKDGTRVELWRVTVYGNAPLFGRWCRGAWENDRGCLISGNITHFRLPSSGPA